MYALKVLSLFAKQFFNYCILRFFLKYLLYKLAEHFEQRNLKGFYMNKESFQR